MEYIYAAMLLHKAGKPVNEESLSQVLNAAGVNADSAKVKALVASLAEVDIDEAIKSAPTFMAAPAPSVSPEPEPVEEAEKEEKEEKKEKEALEGLGALFA
jgi:large subunit ribosomal protein L12